MKITRKESEFQPVVIALETQDEVDQLYAVMRYIVFKNKEDDISEKLFTELEAFQLGDKYAALEWDQDSATLYFI